MDFADVRTVMSEMGMAMMGSASRLRARIAQPQAAEQAVASPLLEDVNLSGARGVLVNITASASLKMKEVHDVMNTIRAFTAEDATVIVDTVIDEAMADELRVTMVATGLGSPVAPQGVEAAVQLVVKTGPTPHRWRSWITRTGDARRHPPAQSRIDHRGDAPIGRGSARHPGVSAQAGGLARR